MNMQTAECKCELEVKRFSSEDTAYHVEGYASIYGNKDLDGDILEQNAFSESLKKRHPLLLVNHKLYDLPIGKIETIEENKKGLKFSASMPKDDTFVSERVAPQLRHGSFSGVSVGFRALESTCDNKGFRRIEKAELFEISLVNMPANPKAQVNSFKSITVEQFTEFSLEQREAALKSSGLFSDRLAERLSKSWRDAESKGGMPDNKSKRDAGEQKVIETLVALSEKIRKTAKD